MFDGIQAGEKFTKQEFQARAETLRSELIKAQQRLREADFPVIVELAGDDRASVNEVANLLHAWLDPRGLETSAFGALSDEERERPPLWRRWRALPARGRIGLFLRTSAHQALIDRATGKISRKAYHRALDRLPAFEQTLVDGGVLFVKFWLHLPQREFRKRKVRDGRRRLDPFERCLRRHYARMMDAVAEGLARTSTHVSSWNLVDSTDARHRAIAVAQTLLDALVRRLEGPPVRSEPASLPAAAVDGDGPRSALDDVDLTQAIEDDAYEKELKRLQARVLRLSWRAREAGVSSVLAFEGWDAAGKGGCIRRLTAAMDAENYRVVPVAAPSDEEKAHHYLWRFWRHLPRAGLVTIFDRSWYGRVLVERVEGFATEAEWRRAYREINEFEAQLAEHGIVVCKFWLHLDKDEQLRRFEERERTEFKRYKITAEDWRNRKSWDAYRAAVEDMVRLTSTEAAPWTLVAANDQRWARLEVLRTVEQRMKKAL